MLVNQSNLAAANTTFETTVNDIFSGTAPGTHTAFTEVVPADGTSIEIVVAADLSAPREWIGSKQFADMRAYKKNVELRKWERSISLPRTQVDGDKTGVVGKRLADFARGTADLYDRIVYDALIANAITGFDGSALLADAHANQVTGATADNLATAALDFPLFRTAMDALEQMKTLGGEPMGIYGNTIVVGSLLRRVAMEVTGSNRPAPVANNGALDTGTIVAVHTFENYLGGSVNVIVTPRITGNEWFLFDLSKSTKPMLLAEFRKPTAVSQTSPESDSRFENDEYRWSLECDASPCPGAWQLAYGSVSA